MNFLPIVWILVISLTFSVLCGQTAMDGPVNILCILVDDLGNGDLDIPSEVDGISFLPLLQGKDQEIPERSLFWVRREGGKYGGQAYYAARKGDHKILQNTPYEAIQYFNIKEDPYEQEALEQVDSEIFKNLREELRKHIQHSGSIPWQK